MKVRSIRLGRIRWRALIVLSLLFGLAGGGAYVLRKYMAREAARKALVSGKAAYDDRRFSQAAGNLGVYLSRNPSDIEIRLKYADAQLKRRPQVGANLQEAIRAYEQILRYEPAHAEAAKRLIEIYLRTNSKLEARRVAKTWYDRAVSDLPARRYWVRVLLAQEKDADIREASETVAKWLESSPGDPSLLCLKAGVLLAQNKAEDAKKELEFVVKEHPEHVEGGAALAALLWDLKDAKGANDVLDKLVADNVKSSQARLSRGRFHLLTGNRDMAGRDLDEAVRLADGDVTLLITAGTLLAGAGYVDAAVAAFDGALKAEPHNVAIYVTCAEAVLESGDAVKSGPLAERLMAAPLGEQHVDVLIPAADLFAVAGSAEGVRKCLDDLRAANARTEDLRYVEGLAAMLEGRPYEAIRHFEQVVQGDAGNARAQLLLGRCLMRTGNERRAVKALDQYVGLRREANKPAGTAQLELAQLYASLRRPEELAALVSEAGRSGDSRLTSDLLLIQMELMGELARPNGPKPDPRVIDEMALRVAELSSKYPNALPIQVLNARLKAWQGKIDEAVNLLRGLQVTAADKFTVARTLIDLYAGRNEYDKAIAEAEATLKSAKLEQDKELALKARLAELQAQARRLPEARSLLEEVIAKAEGRARSVVRIQLARLLKEHDQVDAAREVLWQIAAEDPEDLRSRLMLFEMEPVPGKGPDRQTLVDQMKKIEGPEGIAWKYAQAVILLNPSTPPQDWRTYPHAKEIETLLTACVGKDPEWHRAVLALGMFYERMGDNGKALDTYRNAFSSDPQNADVARQLALLSARLQHWDDLGRALQALPADDPAVHQLQLLRALRQGDRTRAIELLKEAIKKDTEGKDAASRLQLSSLLRDGDDFEESERLLDEAGRIEPNSPDVLAARVQMHLKRGRIEPARRLCEEAVSRDPQPGHFQLLAAVHEANGDVSAADAALRKMASFKDSAENGFLSLGRLHYQRGDSAKAIDCWREGLSAIPQSRVLRSAMAEAIVTGGDPAQAAEASRLIDELIAEQPDDLAVLLLRADVLYRSDPAKGDAELDRLQKQHPESPALVRKRIQFAALDAQAEEGLGRPSQARVQRSRAVELVDRALRSSPRDVGLLLLKSTLLVKDNPALAAVAARQALEIDSSSERAIVAYALALAARQPLARAEVDEVLKVGRSFLDRPDAVRAFDARLALATLCLLLADQAPEYRRQADEFFEQVAASAPPQAYHALAVSLSQLNRGSEAKAVLLRGLQAHQQNEALVLTLASVSYQLGQYQEAADVYRRAMALRPGDYRPMNDLAFVLSEHLANPGEAEALAAKAVQMCGQDPSPWDTWGAVLFQLGKYAESRDALEKALAYSDEKPSTRQSALFHLGRTMMRLDPAMGRERLSELLAIPATQRLISAAAFTEAASLLGSGPGTQESSGISAPQGAATAPQG